MTRVALNLDKNAFENANEYFSKAKRAKEKLASLKKAMLDLDQKILKGHDQVESQKKTVLFKRKKEWFEKFHWMFTSGGFLVIAGRDKTSNEHLVKKVMLPKDVYFHGTANGSAHAILVTEGKKPGKDDLNEAAQFAGIWSGDWKNGSSNTDVYSVKPEQVSKQAPTGESMGSGAFMIYGEREWYRKVPLRISVGVEENGRVVSGPKNAVKNQAKITMELIPGEKKKSDIAKQIKRFFEKKGVAVQVDDLLGMIPSECRTTASD